MITVGLDFGTHQTKLCVERKEGVELEYSFMQFEDTDGCLRYTLPSIIQIGEDGLLRYGYLKCPGGRIVRYFKQATFTDTFIADSPKRDAMLFSIWYIAYILFDLEDKYGQNFTIQMGVPTDSGHFAQQKKQAISILASAYRLVEDEFDNDKNKFLASSYSKLKEITEIVEYDDKLREIYQMLVFPEAYACLSPLISSSKLANGMSLMVDVGGGTTDISFFTIVQGKPRVYDFYSINKGLNYLSSAYSVENKSLDSNVRRTQLQDSLILKYSDSIKDVCRTLKNKLKSEFLSQSNLPIERLWQSLQNRPIVYTGGGSTFEVLRKPYDVFRDVIQISEAEWKKHMVKDIHTIVSMGLCPILSTAYGLSISQANDDIVQEPFSDLFKGLRQTKNVHINNKRPSKRAIFGREIGGDSGFSYGDDYDAWK